MLNGYTFESKHGFLDLSNGHTHHPTRPFRIKIYIEEDGQETYINYFCDTERATQIAHKILELCGEGKK